MDSLLTCWFRGRILYYPTVVYAAMQCRSVAGGDVEVALEDADEESPLLLSQKPPGRLGRMF